MGRIRLVRKRELWLFFKKLSANIEEIITSSQDAASIFFQNKLSHKQFVFSLLHHLEVYFPTWLY